MSDTPRTTPTETFAAQIRSVLAQYNDPELPVTHLVGKLKAEVEKWRTAASVLCAAHVGKPQSSCPVCEVEKLKAYAQMADERLCKFTHGEMAVEQRDEINAVINILKRARYGDDSIFRDVKLEKIIADNASEQAERYSVEEYKEWRRLSNGTIAIDDPDHGIAAFVAARRKEQG